MKAYFHVILCALLFGLLQGCESPEESSDMVQQAIAIESGDECHLCGMIINNFDGPKGQVYSRGIKGNMKFCSTRDMFAFMLDPENQHNIQKAFVHDMAVTPWDHPDDKVYIDAKKAFYVIGHRKKGAMGPTLASFAQRADAVAFSTSEGGKVLSFDQITLHELMAMNMMQTTSGHSEATMH